MGSLLQNVSTFLGKLFHWKGLTTCEGVYLFSEPNQILFVLIGVSQPPIKTFAERCSRKNCSEKFH